MRAAHVTVRHARRVSGRIQTRRSEVSGEAPRAVLDGLRAAVRGVRSEREAQVIDRIELFREFLLHSDEEFDSVDYGAGRRSDPAPQSSVTRTIGTMTRSSKPAAWSFLLFRMMREVRPTAALELGTCVGISAAYQGAALELNESGRLVTLEGAPALAERSRRTLSELGLAERVDVRTGRFADSLPIVLDDIAPVSWAFIDGHHAEEPTLDYMEQVVTRAAGETVLIFDDINWSDGMRRAWRTIADDRRFSLVVDLRSVGIAVISASATSRHSLRIAYH